MTYSELIKILLDKTPSRLLSNQYIKEKLFELIPELEECDGFDQHSEWHPYDVFLHICHVVDDVDNTLPLRLAALFHDIGKPRKYNPTYVGDKEIGHFPLHWEESCLIFKNFAKEYNIDEETVNLVSRLIYHHDHRFKYPKNDTQSFEELNKELIELLVSEFDKDEIQMLYNLRRADLASQMVPLDSKLNYDIEEETILKRYGCKTK